ncbi:putative transporter [Smittium culicis]|uniref:Putative transporter n=1 Tax=Smittium culicis TaxID=133412 RepID=A0A1R1XZE7_9FUNG|nr:putative transporter [Smittium culicis]
MSKFLGKAGSLIKDLEEQMEQEPSESSKNRNSKPESLLVPKKNITKHTKGISPIEESRKSSRQVSPYESTSLLKPSKQEFRSHAVSIRNDELNKSYSQDEFKHSIVEGLDLVGYEYYSTHSTHPETNLENERKLGTFEGVFIPTMLSIFGVIVFVRLGYLVGQAGVLLSLFLFFFGYVVTISTTLSISAIATNGTVKGGGPYYMLSRTLGPEFGGSIGIMFYAGTMLAGSLNVVAFIEPFLNNFGNVKGDISFIFPETKGYVLLYESILLISATLVCVFGSKLFAKANSILSSFLGISVISILLSFFLRSPFENESKNIYYTGISYDTLMSNLYPSFSVGPNGESETFGKVFGVMFPACVGIMAGASMSGSLKTPSKSIPRGTLSAIAVTIVVYFSMVILLGSSTSRTSLKENLNVLQEINYIPILVPIGAISTSITSTLSGIIASANILQAISRDDLFKILSVFKQIGSSEATYAVLGTYLISQLVIFYGDVNSVASYVTLFNLLMFASTNFALFVLKLVGATNFRPTFKYFSVESALIGVVSSLAAMFMVDVFSTIVTIIIMTMLMAYVHKYVMSGNKLGEWPHNWGSIGQGLIYHQVRKYILQLDKTEMHVKYWRPQILLLLPPVYGDSKNLQIAFRKVTESGSENQISDQYHSPDYNSRGVASNEHSSCSSRNLESIEQTSKNLIEVGNLLKKGGLYIVGQVVVGKFRDCLDIAKLAESQLLSSIEKNNYKAFVSVSIAKNFHIGARMIMMGSGLGGMKPNIVIFKAKKFNISLNTCKKKDLQKTDFSNDNSSARKSDNNSNIDKKNLECTKSEESNIDEFGKISCVEMVQTIEEVLLLKKSVGLCYNFSDHDFGVQTKNSNSKYIVIDLWPLQITNSKSKRRGSARNLAKVSPSRSSSIGSDNGLKVELDYESKFDSYTLVLQLGSIMKQHYEYKDKEFKLRVFTIVEHEFEVKEEMDEVKDLLKRLRIRAELEIVCLSKFLYYKECFSKLLLGENTIKSLNSGSKSKKSKDLEELYISNKCDILNSTDGGEARKEIDNIQTGKMKKSVNFSADYNNDENFSKSKCDDSKIKPIFMKNAAIMGASKLMKSKTFTEETFLKSNKAFFKQHGGVCISSNKKSNPKNNTGTIKVYPKSPIENSTSSGKQAATAASSKALMSKKKIFDFTEQFGSSEQTKKNEMNEESLGNTEKFVIDVKQEKSTKNYELSSVNQFEDKLDGINFSQENSKGKSYVGQYEDAYVEEDEDDNGKGNWYFNKLPHNQQNKLLNLAIKKYSTDCDLLISTLPAPEIGTCDSFEQSSNYIKNLESLIEGIDTPLILVHSTKLSVTTLL